ncbi:Xaa-Pro peptidase family protein [Ancylobacter sp. A5.8]|uniref:M24 family metallopeptidase n=1 Tax=Ancylobacter gelatini TaxID=2919920 RepID=UPI001F4EAF2C|nr:Xaa-Pro peptidase family protein [Ancylobacter gelatini]MCJ8142853.1 Xaa-Pro peptidase family protein [Ancylobacter gelatini]
MNTALASIPQGVEAAFPQAEFAARLAALRDMLKERGADLYLTTQPENIFYLSGQQSPGYYVMQCLCVPAEGPEFLIIRSLESYNARANTYLEDIETYADGVPAGLALGESLKRRGFTGRTILADKSAWFLTVQIYEALTSAIGPTGDGSGLVELLRRVKSPAELACIDESARITDAGMREGLAVVAAGVSENDIAARVMAGMIAAGSEYVGMEPFVTSGPRGGLPHSTWRRRRIEPGDIGIIENASSYNRYHVGLFRTFSIGAPSALAADQYATCMEALDKGLAACAPGVPCSHVHEVVEGIIQRAGFGDGFRKRAGYSEGIAFAPDWGEGNVLSLNRGVETPLAPGMVFHVPVTLRAYYQHTVAVSETVVITEDGHRTVSTVSRDMVIV